VRFGDAFWILRKELSVAVVLGAIMALATYVRAWTLEVGPGVGLVVAVTASCIVLWSATVASVLPVVLRRLRPVHHDHRRRHRPSYLLRARALATAPWLTEPTKAPGV
jgi:hypothetical protein